MATDLNLLGTAIQEAFGGQVASASQIVSMENKLGELTLQIRAENMHAVLLRLRDDAKFKFEQLTDLCGVDYSTYGSDISEGGVYYSADASAPCAARPYRFAVVYHLLSITNNARLRVRVFAEDDGLPMLPSAVEIWPAANWYEREAFDLYGIIFTGHPDLRRLLTDYGFVGNPFRKDFPLSGHVEMRYDEEQKRVVYQPVSIDPREVTPRIVREDSYGGMK
jgi:NADH-quinone oxidoreductase subunit C